MNTIIKQLSSIGTHIGHVKFKWNPNMENYLFGHINNLHILDLEKTINILIKVKNLITKIIEQNRKVLIITDKDYNLVSNKNVQFAESSLLLNGCLTNLTSIKNIQNTILINNQKRKKNIKFVTSLPDLIIILNVDDNISIIKEATLLNIPVIALVDSNNNPNTITYPLPSNNESYKVKSFFLNYFTKVVNNIQTTKKITFNNEFNLYSNLKI